MELNKGSLLKVGESEIRNMMANVWDLDPENIPTDAQFNARMGFHGSCKPSGRIRGKVWFNHRF